MGRGEDKGDKASAGKHRAPPWGKSPKEGITMAKMPRQSSEHRHKATATTIPNHGLA